MTSETTTATDLGAGWAREGQNAIWTGEPEYGERDLLRVSIWSRDGQPHLRIEMAHKDQDDEGETTAEALEQATIVHLPIAALPELCMLLARILDQHGLFLGVLQQLNDERDAALQRLIEATGGNMDATVAEAEEALKAQQEKS